MADLVLPGAWWLRGTRGSNVFAVEAADGQLALVDTGFGSSASAVLHEIEQLAAGRRLAAILLTHGHSDHAGAAAALRAATGAMVVAGRGDCIAGPNGSHVLVPHLGRSHLWRRLRRGAAAAAVTVDCAVSAPSEALPGIMAVPVPGHTPGSLCFVARNLGAAFVGDLVIIHGQELTRPLRAANSDDALYLESLRVFAAEAPAHGFPGHGPPMLDSFGEELRRLAALPRRRPSPLRMATRMRRLASFGHRLTHRR